jgi:hypothetical protein
MSLIEKWRYPDRLSGFELEIILLSIAVSPCGNHLKIIGD